MTSHKRPRDSKPAGSKRGRGKLERQLGFKEHRLFLRRPQDGPLPQLYHAVEPILKNASDLHCGPHEPSPAVRAHIVSVFELVGPDLWPGPAVDRTSWLVRAQLGSLYPHDLVFAIDEDRERLRRLFSSWVIGKWRSCRTYSLSKASQAREMDSEAPDASPASETDSEEDSGFPHKRRQPFRISHSRPLFRTSNSRPLFRTSNSSGPFLGTRNMRRRSHRLLADEAYHSASDVESRDDDSEHSLIVILRVPPARMFATAVPYSSQHSDSSSELSSLMSTDGGTPHRRGSMILSEQPAVSPRLRGVEPEPEPDPATENENTPTRTTAPPSPYDNNDQDQAPDDHLLNTIALDEAQVELQYSLAHHTSALHQPAAHSGRAKTASPSIVSIASSEEKFDIFTNAIILMSWNPLPQWNVALDVDDYAEMRYCESVADFFHLIEEHMPPEIAGHGVPIHLVKVKLTEGADDGLRLDCRMPRGDKGRAPLKQMLKKLRALCVAGDPVLKVEVEWGPKKPVETNCTPAG